MYYLSFSDLFFDQNKKFSTINSSGTIEKLPDDIRLSIPRDVRQRGFSFSPLQYLALEQLLNQQSSSESNPDNTGILLGSESGGFYDYFKQGKRFQKKGIKRVSPFTIPRTIHNTGSAVLAIENKFQGVSAGYNGDESVGLVSFIDSLTILNACQEDIMVFGSGEQFFNNNSHLVDASLLGLISRKQNDNAFAFDVPFSLGRGKPWLSEQDNKADLLACAKEHLGELPESLFSYAVSPERKSIHTSDEFKIYHDIFPALKSLGPVLGLQHCLRNSNEFVYVVTSNDGFGIILVVKQY